MLEMDEYLKSINLQETCKNLMYLTKKRKTAGAHVH